MLTTTYAPVSLVLIHTLDNSTAAVLEFARGLVIDKEYLPRKDFNKMVQSLGWSKGVVSSYLKIGKAFLDVEINRLINIEPRTLFKITSSKKFAQVVEGIKNSVGHITQQFVEHLISSTRKKHIPKQSKATIWRGDGANRDCVIPIIKEDDHYTGVTIQRAMDEEGITAQRFVREAAALREAFHMGALAVVGELPQHLAAILGIEYSGNSSENNDKETSDSTIETITVAISAKDTESLEELTSKPIAEESKTLDVVAIQIATQVENKQESANSIQELSAEEIAALLNRCTSWEEITKITSALDEHTRIESWGLLSKKEQAYIIEMKKGYTQQEDTATNTIEEKPIIKVGDKVIWVNCFPHLNNRQPFTVENIEDDYAKLNTLISPVPIEELSLFTY